MPRPGWKNSSPRTAADLVRTPPRGPAKPLSDIAIFEAWVRLGSHEAAFEALRASHGLTQAKIRGAVDRVRAARKSVADVRLAFVLDAEVAELNAAIAAAQRALEVEAELAARIGGPGRCGKLLREIRIFQDRRRRLLGCTILGRGNGGRDR